MGYITPYVYQASRQGAQYQQLGATELQNAIDRASEQIDQWAGWTFAANPAHEETLYSGIGRDVVIGRDGSATIYAKSRFPINSVSTLTYRPRTPVGSGSATGSAGTTVAVSSANRTILTNEFGEGYAVKVWVDLSAYRQPGQALEWYMIANCGFSTPVIPYWLQDATILWVTGRLNDRGSQVMETTDAGFVPVDVAQPGGQIKRAMAVIAPHRKRF